MTAVFLLIFVVQLVIYGFHELTEANIFPNSQPWHDATEPFGPDGIYGQYLTYLLVLLPLTWLAVSSFLHRGGIAPIAGGVGKAPRPLERPARDARGIGLTGLRPRPGIGRSSIGLESGHGGRSSAQATDPSRAALGA